jgi:DNA gyrase/topoisomerase IV subunit A
MDREDVLDRIVEHAEQGKPDQLLETTVASLDSDLYEAAAETFGSWDAALAEALCRAVDSGGTRGSSPRREENIVRKAVPAAKHQLFVTTEKNAVFRLPGMDLEVTDQPEYVETPAERGAIAHVHHLGEPEGVVLFSNQGRYFGLHPRLIPKYRGGSEIRGLESMLGTRDDEALEFALPKRAFFDGRIVHVTRGGKGKASDGSDYETSLDKTGHEAFGLADGDRPVAVIAAPEGATLFCASALGRGIHFPADEIRSMGLRAMGVNVMDLDDEEGDAVVGAFRGHNVRQVAVLTEEGYGKRVPFEEFRQQGRAGAGMQLLRLNPGDRVAGVAPVSPSDDVVVTTSRGRVHRRPAGDFELMGRPAKGNRVMETSDDEAILEFARLPCSG